MKHFFSLLLEKYHHLVFYCLIGCTGATIDFLIFCGLTVYLGLHHQIANFFSISCGIINNFMLNYFFNFKSNGRFFLRLLSFYAIGMVGFFLSAGMLYILIDIYQIPGIFAKFLTIFVVTVLQYCLNKCISFRKTRGRND